MGGVWMSELARRAGLPVATVKYYLREQLLHPGETVGATRSRYDDTHVRRLRLVRALTEVAGLSLEQVRAVLEATTQTGTSRHATLGAAHSRLPPVRSSVTEAPHADAVRAVRALLERHGWAWRDGDPYLVPLVSALSSMAALGPLPSDEQLDAYAEAARTVAVADVASSTRPDPAEAVERLVVGTLLLEPVLLALRRVAHRELSATSELAAPDGPGVGQVDEQGRA